MDIRVTKHAEKRMRERLGINKGSVGKAAQSAFDRGAKYEDTTGKLRHFLDEKIICYGNKSIYRIYGEWLYVFSGDGFLVTIVPLYSDMIKCVKRRVAHEVHEKKQDQDDDNG